MRRTLAQPCDLLPGFVLSLMCVFLFTAIPEVRGQQSAKPSKSVELAMKQSQLADRYRQLESMLLRMAEFDASNNPRRAALLRQTLSKGKDLQIGGQMDALVKVFQREQLQKALENQTNVQTDLKALLDLLLSENRPDRLKNEQARVRDYIKQLDRIIRQQKSVRGRTESGESTKRLATDQSKIANSTNKLAEKIDESEGLNEPGESGSDERDSAENGSKESQDEDTEGSDKSEKKDAESDPTGDGEQGEGQQSQGQQSQGQQSQGQQSQGQQSQGQQSQGQQSQGQQSQGQQSQGQQSQGQQSQGQQSQGQQSQGQQSQGQQSQGQQSQGQQSQGQQSQGQQSQGQQNQGQQNQEQQFPGRKRIAAAEDRMRQAQEKLDKAQREQALEDQEQAQRLLEQARAELEEILRQLREEEIERVLALLEGRFRKMLEMELRIRDSTVRLNKTPAAKRTRQFTVQASKLSLDQRKVILEVDKALTLLREEGSSVAFPEATEQMRGDMQIVARRLAEEKVGSFTQDVEGDIITALEEMIAALQKAQKDAEERRQQQQQGQPQQMDPNNQPLVNKIAELKMIRALQMRVNKRTASCSKALLDVEDPVGQATDDDLLESLRDLSDREKRIQKITSDIVLGKNQ